MSFSFWEYYQTWTHPSLNFNPTDSGSSLTTSLVFTFLPIIHNYQQKESRKSAMRRVLLDSWNNCKKMYGFRHLMPRFERCQVIHLTSEVHHIILKDFLMATWERLSNNNSSNFCFTWRKNFNDKHAQSVFSSENRPSQFVKYIQVDALISTVFSFLKLKYFCLLAQMPLSEVFSVFLHPLNIIKILYISDFNTPSGSELISISKMENAYRFIRKHVSVTS